MKTTYHFKQSVHIDGRDFPQGNHEVSEEQENHPHFLKYVGCGYIEEAKLPPVVVESQQERGNKLLERLVKKADAKKAKAQAQKEEPKSPEAPPEPVEPDGEAACESESSPEADAEEKPKGKSDKKPKR